MKASCFTRIRQQYMAPPIPILSSRVQKKRSLHSGINNSETNNTEEEESTKPSPLSHPQLSSVKLLSQKSAPKTCAQVSRDCQMKPPTRGWAKNHTHREHAKTAAAFYAKLHVVFEWEADLLPLRSACYSKVDKYGGMLRYRQGGRQDVVSKTTGNNPGSSTK